MTTSENKIDSPTSSNNNTPSHSSTYIYKEQLYNLFYELKSEIQGCKIEIDEDEYEENVKSTSFQTIFKYVRDTIQILLQTKNKIITQQAAKLQSPSSSFPNDNYRQLEALLRNAEFKQRKLLKRIFMYKLQREALENRMNDYAEMEVEYEEMKMKYKYEDGRFLNNDRKDNEIYILRSENTNLKKEIMLFEKKVKDLKTQINDVQCKLNEKEKECLMLASLNVNLNSEKTVHSTKNKKTTSNHISHCESSPQLKLSPTTLLNLTSNSLVNTNNNNNNKFIHKSNNNNNNNSSNSNSSNDFLLKYFSNTHRKSHNNHNKNNSLSNQLSHNSSNIKITRLPLGNLTNRHNNSNSNNVNKSNSNSQIPPINQINNKNIHRQRSNHPFKQLFKNNSTHNMSCFPLSSSRKQLNQNSINNYVLLNNNNNDV